MSLFNLYFHLCKSSSYFTRFTLQLPLNPFPAMINPKLTFHSFPIKRLPTMRTFSNHASLKTPFSLESKFMPAYPMGLGLDRVLATKSLHLYCVCNPLRGAHLLFDKIPKRNFVSVECLHSGLCMVWSLRSCDRALLWDV